MGPGATRSACECVGSDARGTSSRRRIVDVQSRRRSGTSISTSWRCAREAQTRGAQTSACAPQMLSVRPAAVVAVGPASDVTQARADGDGDARIGATVSADVETQTPWRSWLQWKATWPKKGGGGGSSGTPLPRGNPSCVCCMKLANKGLVDAGQTPSARSMWLPSTHAKCTVLTPLCGTPGVRRMKSTGSSAP